MPGSHTHTFVEDSANAALVAPPGVDDCCGGGGGAAALSNDTEAMLRMLRRGLLLSLESMDPGVFEMKLNFILDSAGECADLVLMSALDLEGRTALHIAVETEFIEAVSRAKHFTLQPSSMNRYVSQAKNDSGAIAMLSSNFTKPDTGV